MSLISPTTRRVMATFSFSDKPLGASTAAPDPEALQQNAQAYVPNVALRPQVLRDVSSVSTATTVLGEAVACPRTDRAACDAFAAATGRLTATAGVRYYDFEEVRVITTGGLFANGDNREDTTKSDGFTPRFLASFEASDRVTINAQASKGFRLGGVNDPLNLPLCRPEDAALFGGKPKAALISAKT